MEGLATIALLGFVQGVVSGLTMVFVLFLLDRYFR